MALELSKIRVSALLSRSVFVLSLSNLVNMLVGISQPSSITSQVPHALLNYGSWIVQKLNKWYLLSKSNILLPKILSLPLNLPQIRWAYFVSVWHSCLSLSKQRTTYCKGVWDCAMSLFSVFHFDRVQKNVFSCDDCGFTDSSWQ